MLVEPEEWSKGKTNALLCVKRLVLCKFWGGGSRTYKVCWIPSAFGSVHVLDELCK